MLLMERRQAIRKLLLEEKMATVVAVADHFNVSTETVRRDFDALSEEGFLKKTYGGAALVTRSHDNVPQSIRSGILVENKRRMAQRAVSFLKPNDCIFLDHSTSVAAMGDFILEKQIPLTVMTNSMLLMKQFSDAEFIKLVITGGYFDIVTQGIFGMETVRFLQKHNMDKAFLTCQAISMEKGLNDITETIGELRRNIIESAAETYLLIDNSKFGKTAFTCTSDFSGLYTVITDEDPGEDWLTFFDEKDVQVEIVAV